MWNLNLTYKKCNRLFLNISKCKYTIFHKSQLNIENISIDRVSDFNVFGLTINACLNGKSHIDKHLNKISKTMGVLNKLKCFVRLNTKVINSVLLKTIVFFYRDTDVTE